MSFVAVSDLFWEDGGREALEHAGCKIIRCSRTASLSSVYRVEVEHSEMGEGWYAIVFSRKGEEVSYEIEAVDPPFDWAEETLGEA